MEIKVIGVDSRNGFVFIFLALRDAGEKPPKERARVTDKWTAGLRVAASIELAGDPLQPCGVA